MGPGSRREGARSHDGAGVVAGLQHHAGGHNLSLKPSDACAAHSVPQDPKGARGQPLHSLRSIFGHRSAQESCPCSTHSMQQGLASRSLVEQREECTWSAVMQQLERVAMPHL